MRAWLPPTAAVALLAAAAVLMSGEDPGGPRASQPQARRAAPSEPPPALLAELEGAQQTAEVETLAALPVSEARSAVASEAGDTQEPGAVGGPDLHGFVRDASGRPVAGLAVQLLRDEELFLWRPEPFQDFGPGGSSAPLPPMGARTDASGGFRFEGVSPAAGQRLATGVGWFTQPLVVEVDPALPEQSIVLPGRSELAGILELELRDEQGDPLEIARVESHLVALAAPHPPTWSRHDPAGVYSAGWRTTLTGLAPGRWELWVFAQGGGVARVEAQVKPHERVLVPLQLPRRSVFPKATLALEAGGEEVPEGDLDSGFGTFEIKGQQLRGLGQGGYDRNFRHTFRFAPGGIRGALLELELSAAGWADNDGVNLEYEVLQEGGHRWAWGARITSLPGAPSSWQRGSRARIQLDLARLPGKEGEVDLRPWLQDGKLDLFIQDDTIVHAVRLLLDP